jgi:hypothetical protein
VSKAAGWASYGLRFVAAVNILLLGAAAYRADDRLFNHLYPWLVGSSFAVILVALVGLLSRRTWKSKIIDLLFAIPTMAILYFISISSIPGI